MAQKEIEIIIPADGSPPSIEALGYTGQECSQDIKKVIEELGAKNISKRRTADWYKKRKVKIQQKIN